MNRLPTILGLILAFLVILTASTASSPRPVLARAATSDDLVWARVPKECT